MIYCKLVYSVINGIKLKFLFNWNFCLTENHCDINAVARRSILNKINIMTSKSSNRTPNSIIYTISTDTNLVNLISNHNDILTSLTYESQIHLSRIVARYITNCFNNRKKFLESTNAAPTIAITRDPDQRYAP